MSSLTLRQVALTFCSPWASLLFYWFSWQMICLVPCPLRMKSYLPKGKNLHVLVLDNWTGLFLSHVHICTCPIQNTADTHKCPYLKKQLLLSLCQHYGTFCGLKWKIWWAKMFFKFKLVQFVNFVFFIIISDILPLIIIINGNMCGAKSTNDNWCTVRLSSYCMNSYWLNIHLS